MFVLTDPMASGLSRVCRLGEHARPAPAPRSDRRATCRCRAPRRTRPRAGSTPAFASARRTTASCAGPFGTVRPLLRPSWLTADPRITARIAIAVAPRVRRALQHDHRRSLRPARSRRRARRRSCTGRRAPASAPSSSAIVDVGREDQVDAAGERDVALCSRRLWQARWTATSDDEQAVSTARLGPRRPSTYERRPAATLRAGAGRGVGVDRPPRSARRQPQ